MDKMVVPNIFFRNGYHLARDVVAASDEELLAMRGFGFVSLATVNRILAEHYYLPIETIGLA